MDEKDDSDSRRKKQPTKKSSEKQTKDATADAQSDPHGLLQSDPAVSSFIQDTVTIYPTTVATLTKVPTSHAKEDGDRSSSVETPLLLSGVNANLKLSGESSINYTEEDLMTVQIINRCIVGREEPTYVNRGYVVPTCYVPFGTASASEAEARHRGEVTQIDQIDGRNSLYTNVTDNDVVDSAEKTEDKSVEVTNSSVPDKKAFRKELGLQYNPGTSLMCPFLIHQRVGITGFIPNEKTNNEDKREEAQPSSTSNGASKLDEISPFYVIQNVIKNVTAAAESRNLVTAFSSVSTPTFELESTLLKQAASRRQLFSVYKDSETSIVNGNSDFSMDEYIFVDTEVRLGCGALAPEQITPRHADLLTLDQYEYASRFQLLPPLEQLFSVTDENVTASTTTTTVKEPSSENNESGEGDVVSEQPQSTVKPEDKPPKVKPLQNVHIVDKLIAGAFDPYIPATTFKNVVQAVTKMSRGSFTSDQEATMLKGTMPKFQLVFQRRDVALRSDLVTDENSQASSVLVLETSDGGVTWYHVAEQKCVGSFTAPIINSRKISLETSFTAKHLKRCDMIVSEWASYYLDCAFSDGAGAAAEARRAKVESESGGKKVAENQKNFSFYERKRKTIVNQISFTENSSLGFSHPISTLRKAEFEELKKNWQLIHIEKTLFSLAHCVDSLDFLPNLARSAEIQGKIEDQALYKETTNESLYMNSQESPTQSEEEVAKKGIRNLFVVVRLHTKTLFIDNGICFIRGASTFRRRLTISNEKLHNALRDAMMINAPSKDEISSISLQIASAMHSVLNEGINVLSHKLTIGSVPGKILMGMMENGVPAFVFLSQDQIWGGKAGHLPKPSTIKQQRLGQSNDVAEKPLVTCLSLFEHGQYLRRLTIRSLPTVDIAQSTAFHALIPWHKVRYPITLNRFPSVLLPRNIPSVGQTLMSGSQDRVSNDASLTSTVLVRDCGTSLVFVDRLADIPVHAVSSIATDMRNADKIPSLDPSHFMTISTENSLAFNLDSRGTLNTRLKEVRSKHSGDKYSAATKRTHANFFEMSVRDAMKELTGNYKEVKKTNINGSTKTYDVTEAPVFTVSYGSEDSSFSTEIMLRDVLHRMLGKSLKTTVSALCISDLPSRAFRALDPKRAQAVTEKVSNLGTRYVTSVYLDSKDASKSFVSDCGRMFPTPFEQEEGIQMILQRMVAPSTLKMGQILIQTRRNPEKETSIESGRELSSDGGEMPYFYRIDLVPEESLNVFRKKEPFHHKETYEKEKAEKISERTDTSKHNDIFSDDRGYTLTSEDKAQHLAALRKITSHISLQAEYNSDDSYAPILRDAESAAATYKELISTAVNVSRVILANTRPINAAELLESKVRGEPAFAYLPRLLKAWKQTKENPDNEQSSNDTNSEEVSKSKDDKRHTKLLERDLSCVVFVEDIHYKASGTTGSTIKSTEGTPTIYVIHRTTHEIITGSDGVARYESTSTVFFTMRDPNIIIGAQGDCEKMQKMLEAAEGNSSEFSGPSRDGSGSVREPTESVMNCLLVEQGLHILRNFGRWGVDSSFPLQVSRDKLQIDDVTETDHSVDQALQGWLQSTLARQSSDIITMVQGDEKLAQNPLVHMLIDAASRCSTEVQTYCKDELLHWIGALGEVGSILTPQDMEATYLAGVLKSVLMKCGIPIAIHDQLFHPNPKKIDHLNYSDKKKQWTSNDAPNKAVSSETYDHNTAILPADTYCRLTADLIIDVCPGNSKMKGRMVPICLPSTLTTSDGKVLPEGSVAMVGHASSEMIQHCNQYFGEMTPIHQLSDFLLVPATQDVDVTLGIELSQPEDKIWRASLEQQFSRMKTVEGFPTVFRRNRFGQFIPPTVFERTFIQNAGSYVIPPVGEPLYKQGKLVTFSKGYGAHSFVSSVLNSSNMRKIISYVSKR